MCNEVQDTGQKDHQPPVGSSREYWTQQRTHGHLVEQEYLCPACFLTMLMKSYGLTLADFKPNRLPGPLSHSLQNSSLPASVRFPEIEKQSEGINNHPQTTSKYVHSKKRRAAQSKKCSYRKTQKSKQSQPFCALIIQRELRFYFSYIL